MCFLTPFFKGSVDSTYVKQLHGVLAHTFLLNLTCKPTNILLGKLPINYYRPKF